MNAQWWLLIAAERGKQGAGITYGSTAEIGGCQAATTHLQIVASFVSEEAALERQRHEGSGDVRLLRDHVADAFAFAKSPGQVEPCQLRISVGGL